MADYDFKVALESLHTTKIREISYEGEETHQENPSLSQKFTELARRVDFSKLLEEDEGEAEPVAKKGTQKWPWEFTHSKLKQALTEVSVLSDVLQIVHNHRHYVALDPTVQQSSPVVPPAYQYIVKKKALGVAAGILRRGAKSLITAQGDREYYSAISSLRQRWKLRRTPAGTIVGDLSYHSAGSQYPPVAFGVLKGVGQDVLQVTVPRELRGASEIVVFLSSQPVTEVSSLSLLRPSPMEALEAQCKQLPPWEQKLVAAQNMLFNQELFAQLVREAYDQKDYLQFKVFSNKILIPLGPDSWLSVLHVRESEDQKSEQAQPPPAVPQSLPQPRWALVIALKQLLRDNQRQRTSRPAPRPSSAGFTEPAELRGAGVGAFTAEKIKEQTYKDNIFNRFMQKVQHLHNEECLQRCLVELCASSSDHHISVAWAPSLSLTSTAAHLRLMEPTSGAVSCSLAIHLSVDTVSVQQIEEDVLTLPLQTDCLLRVLRHQAVVHHMQLACQAALSCGWNVLQRYSSPPLSLTLAKSSGEYLQACNMVVESPNARKRLDVLLEWSRVVVSVTEYAAAVTTADSISAVAPKSSRFTLVPKSGQSFQQTFTNMLASHSSSLAL